MLIYVMVGGAVGAAARYGLGGWIQDWSGSTFPWGTLVVNVSGSLLIGFSVHLLEALPVSVEMRALVTIGLLGAFTTFSTFSYETLMLAREGLWGRALAYTLGSLVLGLVAVVAGYAGAVWTLHLRG
jgi:fluoride exporter